MTSRLLIVLLIATAPGMAAAQGIIDFETIPGGTPSDGLVISNQFLASHGVSFALQGGGFPRLAQIGNPLTAFQGFGGQNDTPAPSANGGSFFLVDDGVFGGAPPPFLVNYAVPVAAASGVVLDMDGTEQWTIEARNSSGALLQSMILNPNNTLDGSGTLWSFSRASADIAQVVLRSTGASNVGFALDNFSSSALIPEPGTYALLAFGLLGLGLIIRRRR